MPNDSFKNGVIQRFAIDLPAEISINANVEDGLINGSPCIMKHLDFRLACSDRWSIVWVLFDDTKIGDAKKIKDSHLYTENIPRFWSPFVKVSKKLLLVYTNPVM